MLLNIQARAPPPLIGQVDATLRLGHGVRLSIEGKKALVGGNPTNHARTKLKIKL
jgi:hypothetical protein